MRKLKSNHRNRQNNQVTPLSKKPSKSITETNRGHKKLIRNKLTKPSQECNLIVNDK
jgi:hypothetical protein